MYNLHSIFVFWQIRFSNGWPYRVMSLRDMVVCPGCLVHQCLLKGFSYLQVCHNLFFCFVFFGCIFIVLPWFCFPLFWQRMKFPSLWISSQMDILLENPQRFVTKKNKLWKTLYIYSWKTDSFTSYLLF